MPATHAIIQLRTLVGYLGEQPQTHWWDTAFLNKTGLHFLGINFPRSAFAAGLNAVTAAAQRVHDERIGRGRVHHLFRLPYTVEEDLAAALQQTSPDDLLPTITTREEALHHLTALAGERTLAAVGPVHLGESGETPTTKLVEEMAAYYAGAFSTDQQTFPYFTLT